MVFALYVDQGEYDGLCIIRVLGEYDGLCILRRSR